MSEQSYGSRKHVGDNVSNNPANNNPGRPEGKRLPVPRQGRYISLPLYEGLCMDLNNHVYNVSQVKKNYDIFLTTTQETRESVATHYDDDAKFITGMVEI